ncbi:response regulator [uncultured Reyranella sp.]|jgi:DNA-binding response OmpR family regulator|uniref:response regulator n=1 Tax=uncultured Reyranella sp. TaxID=735512 RepID=UPI00259CF9BA|nr:response regulator [uncultured Reyranella sp.]
MNPPGNSIRDEASIDVLVVDDDAATLEELIEYLSKAGLRCQGAADGWAALEKMAAGVRADVVVSDLRMPELSGMQFAERLRLLKDGKRPEIIFVSGHAGFDDAVEAIRMGARDMLTKPVDGARLVRAVKSAKLIRQMQHAQSPASGEAAPATVRAPRADATPVDPVLRRREALKELKAIRRDRSAHFPADLFSDPCWEMLLDLYDARLAAEEVTVTSLGAASGVPLTTALRRMEALQAHGLIDRVEDRGDKRRTIMRLTEQGLRAVENFFEAYLGRRNR